MADAATAPAVAIDDATSPADEMLYEVVGGQVVETPPMGAYEAWLASVLTRRIGNLASANRLGRVVIEALFTLDAAKLKRRPDVLSSRMSAGLVGFGFPPGRPGTSSRTWPWK